MKISSRLKNNIEDILAQNFSKREIQRFFENNDIENIIDEELPEPGIRRALTNQYYRSIDWTNTTDISNALQVIADIASELEKKNESYGIGYIDNPFSKELELLLKNLKKDGWNYSNGTIIPIDGNDNNLNLNANPVSASNLTNSNIQPEVNNTINSLTNDDEIKPVLTVRPKVFITYSWDGPEHEERVLSFTEHLRSKGFVAEVDKMLIQEQSAINFNIMMHEAFTGYDKIIVVLSTGYKKKAEKFKGGVGNEYSMLINDIKDKPNKYILVSFEGIKNDIVPLALKGREIIDLTIDVKLTDLYYKLMDKPRYEFSEVADKLPELETKKPLEFSLSASQADPFEIVKCIATPGNASKSASKYDAVENECSIEIRNISGKTIDGFSVEIRFPCYLVENPYELVNDGENCAIMTDSSSKVYSNQTKHTDRFTIKVTSRNYHKALISAIKVTVYSELGTSTKEFQLKDVFITGKLYGEIEYLADAQFN